MACYISTRTNRVYAALESSYGAVAPVAASNRFTTVSLKIQHEREHPRRRDKTGSRTFRGIPGPLRSETSFELKTYLYARESGNQPPRLSPVVEAGFGGGLRLFGGGLTATLMEGTRIGFGQAHGLQLGDAITMGAELRFVTSVDQGNAVVINAPFTQAQGVGSVVGGSVNYGLGSSLPSVTLYDYWSPASAVQRIVRGAVVNEAELRISGDFHELVFSGRAADLLDSASLESGSGDLTSFPEEPALEELYEEPVPGHLGQAWIGTVPTRVFTLSKARVAVKNNVELRGNDFGSLYPRCVVPGDREVTVDLELYSRDGGVFDELCQAARSRSPIPLMIQLGEQAGQMCGVYVPNFIPVTPEFVDDENRLRWRLQGSSGVGTAEDEIYAAFG